MNPTRFIANPACIAQGMDKICPNRMAHEEHKHKHVPLTNGRAKAAQTYPNALRKANCKGLVRQTVADKQGQSYLATLKAAGDPQASKKESDRLVQECRPVEEGDSPWLEAAFDDASGAEFDPKTCTRPGWKK